MASFEDLYQIVLDEIEAYRQLVALTQCERDVVRQRNIAELATVLRDKQSWVTRSTAWGNKRQQLAFSLAEQLSLPQPASLADLIALCPKTIAGDLITLREEFIGLIKQLSGLNQGNNLLVQAELAHLDLTLHYLTRLASSPDSRYAANGQGQACLTANSTLNCQV